MPCCTALETSNCCDEEKPVDQLSTLEADCGCTLSQSDGTSNDQAEAVFFHQDLELENNEIVLLVFDEEPAASPEEKPVWVELDHNLRSQEVASFSAFPNPPPRS